MSTILKALDRLEKERGGSNATQASHPLHGGNPGDGMHGHAKRAWLRGRVLIWVGAGIVVCIGAALSFKHFRPIPSAPGASEAGTPLSSTQMMPRANTPTASLPAMAITVSEPEGHRTRNAIHVPRKTEPSALPLYESASDSSAMPAIGSDDAFRQGHDDAIASDQPALVLGGRPADAGPMVSDPFFGASRLDDGRLTVQAIAASDNPDQRLAVINNRVVREGATVDGFTIVGITAKAVYARKAQRLWEVPFGRP